jgi:ABC-2 type transport system permease protein
VSAWINNTAVDLKLIMRDRQALFWSYVFPLFFLFLFSSVFARGQAEGVAMLMPGLLCISVMAGAFFGLSVGLVTARERGILRRYRLAPVKPWMIISSELISGLAVILSSLALQMLVARLVYGFQIKGSLAALAVMLLVGALAFSGLGFIIASVANNAKVAQMMGNIIFFPLMFLGGAAIPRQFLPPSIQKLSELLPSTYMVRGLSRIVTEGVGLSGNLVNLAVLAATFVLALLIASKLFRWESSEPLGAAKKAWAAAVILIFVLAALLT